MCRANGHFVRFYSVAQHSINCAFEAKARGLSERIQIACLLHDASEAYISDITRPVKNHLPEYLEVEKRLQDIIYDKFLGSPLTEDEAAHVEQIDHDLLVCEFDALMEKKVINESPDISSAPSFEFIGFKEGKARFLRFFSSRQAESKGKKSVGIDGTQGGWIAAILSNDVVTVEKLSPSVGEILSRHPDADSVLIDIPIGLPERKTDIRPDQELRNQLKGKASSVFNTPCRQAVYADDYEKANTINQERMRLGLSKQSHAICKGIREVDKFLQTHHEWRNRLAESHPEYGFAVLNNGNPVLEKKSSYFGAVARIGILRKHLNNIDDLIEKISHDPVLKNHLDDVLDAVCLAIIGDMGVRNGFCTIPKDPQKDQKGLLMQIVYAEVN